MAIKSFSHKGVADVFISGSSKRIGAKYQKRMRLLLSAIDAATGPGDLHGAHGFHALVGDLAGRYAMSVSGNWRLTFRFEHEISGDVVDVDFVDYH